MTPKSLLSVVVPTYNRARFIGDAVASIRAQAYADVEVLVVDDGSTDDSETVIGAMGPPVVYLPFEHAGVSAARNRGLAAARGELIAFLDSDDVWPPGSLAARRAHLERTPEVDVVYGRTRVRNMSSTKRRFGAYDESLPIAFPMLGSMLCRRSVVERVGGFDESLAHAEDVDWLARLKEARVAMSPIDDITLEYRIHGGNMTLDIATNQAFLLRALKGSLDRRRG